MNEVVPVKAAGGIVFRSPAKQADPEVLMIYRNGKWDLPKGKMEEGEPVEMCAAREVSEEVGSGIPAIVRDLGTTYHEYPWEDQTIGKTTYWYSMIFTQNEKLSPQTEEGITKVEWVPIQKAMAIAGYDNLLRVLKEFLATIQTP